MHLKLTKTLPALRVDEDTFNGIEEMADREHLQRCDMHRKLLREAVEAYHKRKAPRKGRKIT